MKRGHASPQIDRDIYISKVQTQ